MWQILSGTNYNFMKVRNIAYIISAALIVLSLVMLLIHGGPKLSIDFAGGVLLQVKFGRVVPADAIRTALADAGFEGSEIQHVGDGSEVLIRAKQVGDTRELFRQVEAALQKEIPDLDVTLRRLETVGPKIGKELRGKAIWAVLWSLIGILIYISWRYEFRFAVGAVAALFHDTFITLGILTLAGKEVSLPIVAALLTIAGYSINDTIVVFDRIREQRRLLRRQKIMEIINISINQTLSRTVITAFTTLFAVLALYILGGEVIHDFAFAMLIGIIIGTYSSIFVASALVLEQALWSEARR